MQTYDDPTFFKAYSEMDRSRFGLSASGEWYMLEKLFPKLKGAAVLDLGCGYGWHSKYCAEQGASFVLGIDASKAMIEEAKKRNADDKVGYWQCAIEEYGYPADSYDFVLSNLALHYVEDLDAVYRNVYQTLKPGGVFCSTSNIRPLPQVPDRIGCIGTESRITGLWIGTMSPANGTRCFSAAL